MLGLACLSREGFGYHMNDRDVRPEDGTMDHEFGDGEGDDAPLPPLEASYVNENEFLRVEIQHLREVLSNRINPSANEAGGISAPGDDALDEIVEANIDASVPGCVINGCFRPAAFIVVGNQGLFDYRMTSCEQCLSEVIGDRPRPSSVIFDEHWIVEELGKPQKFNRR